LETDFPGALPQAENEERAFGAKQIRARTLLNYAGSTLENVPPGTLDPPVIKTKGRHGNEP
jgi:hypothetical protein